MAKKLGNIKIINDPVHGFISIPKGKLFKIIDNEFLQRLRRVKQLGILELVYPGALHTRFHHTLGAFHLLNEAFQTLLAKGVEISEEEQMAGQLAILLHDAGHTPFSHSLEFVLVPNVAHEQISLAVLKHLQQKGIIDKNLGNIAEAIFLGTYHKPFLHELISGQLDVDRLDYLSRDSFYTGVTEGVVGLDRIIQMLNVANGHLCVEEKGIYSIEKFLIARRLMYWQVYFHKTALSAELLLQKIIRRARYICRQKNSLFGTPALKYFLENQFLEIDFFQNPKVLNTFAELDDHDVMAAIKVWSKCDDFILSTLCRFLLNRKLYKSITVTKAEIPALLKSKRLALMEKMPHLQADELAYFLNVKTISNQTYRMDEEAVSFIDKKGNTQPLHFGSDGYPMGYLNEKTEKHYLFYFKF